MKTTYKNDKREGLFELWRLNGKLCIKSNYKGGKLEKTYVISDIKIKEEVKNL